MHMLEHQRHRIVGNERHRAGQHLPCHDPHGIQVALRRRLIVLDGLRRQIGGGAQQHAGGRERGRRRHFGQTEIGDLHTAAIVQHDVLGFDVAMHHMDLMRRGKPFEGLADDAQRLTHGEGPLLIHFIAQIHAMHVFHHQIGKTIEFAGVIHLHDMRIGDLCRRLRLPAEAFDELFAMHALRQLRMHHFQRNRAVQSFVDRLVYRRHASLCDFAHNMVAAVDQLALG